MDLMDTYNYNFNLEEILYIDRNIYFDITQVS